MAKAAREVTTWPDPVAVQPPHHFQRRPEKRRPGDAPVEAAKLPTLFANRLVTPCWIVVEPAEQSPRENFYIAPQ
jgi:hypothetical protein